MELMNSARFYGGVRRADSWRHNSWRGNRMETLPPDSGRAPQRKNRRIEGKGFLVRREVFGSKMIKGGIQTIWHKINPLAKDVEDLKERVLFIESHLDIESPESMAVEAFQCLVKKKTVK